MSFYRRLHSANHKRSALVYLVAGTKSVYRVRVEQHPEPPGWVGGKVLWGHDQNNQDSALALAWHWTEHGEMPEIKPPALP